MKIIYFLMASMFLLSSCNKPVSPSEQDAMLMATLYNYYAAEYKALTYQAYNIASQRLMAIRSENPARTDLAIVLDLDETVLDNSPYQAKLIREKIKYDSCWNEWCDAANARLVPGAGEFLHIADSLGFNIFYVSNRKEASVLEGTIENMVKLGLPQTENSHFLLRTTSRSKEERRNKISEKFNIVLLAGDNLGDFYEDGDDLVNRDNQVKTLKQEFGTRYIVLPNAMYGNWVDVLGLNNREKADSLLDAMIKRTEWCR